MKKILFILFLCIFSINTAVCLESKDTCFKHSIEIDIKPEIANQLIKCFASGNFDSLIIFCNSSVDFMVIKEDETISGHVTDYRAIDNLNNAFKSIKYSNVKLMGGENKNMDYMFMAKIIITENNNEFYLNISFVLDEKNSIKTIALF